MEILIWMDWLTPRICLLWDKVLKLERNVQHCTWFNVDKDLNLGPHTCKEINEPYPQPLNNKQTKKPNFKNSLSLYSSFPSFLPSFLFFFFLFLSFAFSVSFFFFFGGKVYLYSPGFPGTVSLLIRLASNTRDLPMSVSRVLGLKVCYHCLSSEIFYCCHKAK